MSEPEKALRIIGLRISNYKRVVAIDLHPDGRSVLVGGRNAQGKSSLLDAIADALGGAKRGSRTELALRTGSVRGEVRVDLGELVVTRTWTPSSDKLIVESPPGSILKSPQAVLDKLVGDLSFDPLAFARQEPKVQAETLRRITGADTRRVDEQRVVAYGERTGINGQLKRARAVRDEVVVPPQPAQPPTKPSITALLDEQRQLGVIIAECDKIESVPVSLEAGIASMTAGIDGSAGLLVQLQERITAAESVVNNTEEALGWLRSAAAAAPEGLGAMASAIVRDAMSQVAGAQRYLREQIATRDQTEKQRDERVRLKGEAEAELEEARQEATSSAANRVDAERRLESVKRALADADAATARHEAGRRLLDEWGTARGRWNIADADVKRLEAEARRLTAIIDAADAEKLRILGAARFPVDGLGLDGDVVTYCGVPFSQASGAEKVRVGFAIGAALNPTLRVILIREGALLDDESLASLLAAAAERGFQVWVETVGDRGISEGVGIIMEDGRVIAQSEPAEPAPIPSWALPSEGQE